MSDSGQPMELTLQLTRDESVSEARQVTEAMLNPAIGNAENCIRFRQQGWTGLGLTEAMQVLEERAKAVTAGDTSSLESTLVAQAAALNSVFVEMVRRTHLNLGEHLQASDTYLKLALRAQSQCRATIETLAFIKNPPVYARQANINNGGNQQVNNGGKTSDPERSARARAGDSNFQQSKLLEQTHGQWLDTGTSSEALRGNQALEAVGEIHRPQD
jgi:hypothetical protein